ncbi:hypothetical protein N7532_011413 [Penicillium argentinense]|uniref:Heterokaryon incompatibility domain-containing protein n=1 Tax=Penicillium argentinense TaxID=1131581 RepID=A0A9W9EII8_9EURO|nr:uncharacterized protein N7532_011413 [Penicillium argentinense]KAJ5082370.1 hypothetical protein N7532_011413 [Penicillium argentinense]
MGTTIPPSNLSRYHLWVPATIPENEPAHPKWLLDTERWKICDYGDVYKEVQRDGYGIMSYTWGRWADWDKPAVGVPDNLHWSVPTVENMPVELARRVVESMHLRYVWWDWMCVPQGRSLTPDHEKAKREEVGKQMAIYAGAKKSLVWLHSTTWGENSAVKLLLKNEVPKDNLEKYILELENLVRVAQEKEHWLSSGWTLQEGVLLSEGILLDHTGEALRDDRFIHNDGYASVIDLTAGLTTFAIRIAAAFMKISEVHDGGDYDEVVQFIRHSKENYKKLAMFLSSLVRSGLIAYTKSSPLYILAGKKSRFYGVKEDECWALLGALGIDTIPTPRLSEDNKDIAAHAWHTRLADGMYLPLGIFFDVHWKQGLPRLSWVGPPSENRTDAIHIQTETGAPFAMLQLRKNSTALYRDYEQVPTDDGFGYIRVLPVDVLEPSSMLYFPISDLEKRGAVRAGLFLGVIDIWAAEGHLEEKHRLTKFSLLSGV